LFPVLCGPNRTLAQHRRLLENDEFSNLARELPLARAITGQHIDKTTMIRLALSYIKLHKVIPSVTPSIFDYDHYWASNLLEVRLRRINQTWLHSSFSILQLMDCFLMVLDPEGDVLYVSETISIYLGLSQNICSELPRSSSGEWCHIVFQVDMTGNSIAEYIHPEDWSQFHLCPWKIGNDLLPLKVFCSSCMWSDMCSVRVKSSLTKRANKKDSLRASPGFKVSFPFSLTAAKSWFHLLPSQMFLCQDSCVQVLRMDMTFYGGCRLIVCSPLPSPILSSVSIRPTSFVITTAIDLSIIYVDSRSNLDVAYQLNTCRSTIAEEIFGEHQRCTASGLKGVSFYSIVHVEDAEIVRRMHIEEFEAKNVKFLIDAVKSVSQKK
uniref:BHLH domain-containing protein n=1 Tax=Haemonchus placei TaxID=6290 RepID=A0A0N4XBD0_HAEPC